MILIHTVLEYLQHYCTEISPKDFYRFIFSKGELETKGEFIAGKYNAIAVSISPEKVKRYTVTDDLDVVDQLCQRDEFCIMSPISYAGKSRKSQNARFLYALAIDLDGLKSDIYQGVPIGIDTLFWQFDGHGPSNYLPKPTMIVMSGSGLHLYYVFQKPIPLFPNIVKRLEVYKRRLTWQLWTQGVSDLQKAVQYESLFQGFRIPGTITKQGTRAKAFVVDQGDKVTMEYMNQFVPFEDQAKDFTYKSALTLSEAQKKYPKWYDKRIQKKAPRGSWVASRAVYDWWKQKVYEKTEDGHRYWSMMALATYAKKCGISRQELESDALGMVDMLDRRGKREDNPFTVDDVLAALEAYNDCYITYPIETISYRTGIPIEKNKRNGRKQELHVQYMNLNRRFKVENGECTNGGRPKGSGTAEKKVREWRQSHPEGKKADCHRETGLDPKTIRKWWSLPENYSN